jgi:signal transduction histidine kinase/CheY-like chemotaxis protein
MTTHLLSSHPTLRILLVEDNPGDAELVREQLAGASPRVEIAHVDNLARASIYLAAGSVDVVLLDLSLPDATGLQAVERMHQAAPAIPIVVLTGLHDEGLGARAVQAGAQDYLVKGQTEEWLLMRAMRYAIERQQLHEARLRIMEQEQAARALAEAQQARATFLAAVGQRLASALDDAGLDECLGAVASLAVPSFADCCVVTRENGGQRRVIVVRHVALDQEAIVRAHYLDAGRADGPWESTLQRQLGASSTMVARLDSREGLEGAITFLHTGASGRRHGTEDLAMMQELGRSASLTVEHVRLYNEARRAVSLREEFVAIASHELRTPLTTLTLQLDMLGSLLDTAPEPLREPLRERHAKLGKQTRRLEQLINDLLDVAKSNTDRLTLYRERVDLHQLACQVTRRLTAIASTAGCAVEVRAAGPVVGDWDPRRLEQLVTNLLSNALKYGKGKRVEIDCSTSQGAAVLSVRDHGIGIAPADAERIFERFERAVSARQFGGLGLGLHIARSIVLAHGGSIGVTSESGQGSTFLVKLPFEPQTAGANQGGA